MPRPDSMVNHTVYATFDYPMFRLDCSCQLWAVAVPVIAGTEGMSTAAEKHRLDVFGLGGSDATT